MTLNILNSHLIACSAFVKFDLRDGNLGYLFFSAPPDTYTILITLQFMEHTNVVPTLAMSDPAPTAVVLSELVRTHAENLRVCLEYNNVDW